MMVWLWFVRMVGGENVQRCMAKNLLLSHSLLFVSFLTSPKPEEEVLS